MSRIVSSHLMFKGSKVTWTGIGSGNFAWSFLRCRGERDGPRQADGQHSLQGSHGCHRRTTLKPHRTLLLVGSCRVGTRSSFVWGKATVAGAEVLKLVRRKRENWDLTRGERPARAHRCPRIPTFTPKARKERLLLHELPEELLVYDLERHKASCLNRMAMLTWRRCDGRATVPEIAEALQAPVDERVVHRSVRQGGSKPALSPTGR